MSDENSNPMITTLRIELSRNITADGQMEFVVGLPDRYSAIEVLGLLSAAQQHVYSCMTDSQRRY